EKASEGDLACLNWIAERCEGKPKTIVAGDTDAPIGLMVSRGDDARTRIMEHLERISRAVRRSCWLRSQTIRLRTRPCTHKAAGQLMSAQHLTAPEKRTSPKFAFGPRRRGARLSSFTVARVWGLR